MSKLIFFVFLTVQSALSEPQKKDLVFANGDKMPVVGLGTWKAPDAEVEVAINAALEAGEREYANLQSVVFFMFSKQVIATSTVHRCTAMKKSSGRSSASGLILEEFHEVICSSPLSCHRFSTVLQMWRSV
jgi:hypothetical protein